MLATVKVDDLVSRAIYHLNAVSAASPSYDTESLDNGLGLGLAAVEDDVPCAPEASRRICMLHNGWSGMTGSCYASWNLEKQKLEAIGSSALPCSAGAGLYEGFSWSGNYIVEFEWDVVHTKATRGGAQSGSCGGTGTARVSGAIYDKTDQRYVFYQPLFYWDTNVHGPFYEQKGAPPYKVGGTVSLPSGHEFLAEYIVAATSSGSCGVNSQGFIGHGVVKGRAKEVAFYSQ